MQKAGVTVDLFNNKLLLNETVYRYYVIKQQLIKEKLLPTNMRPIPLLIQKEFKSRFDTDFNPDEALELIEYAEDIYAEDLEDIWSDL